MSDKVESRLSHEITWQGAPRVGVGAFIAHAEELLLMRRAKPPEAGAWSIPGGKVEPGETLQDAAVRETREEVGLDVEVTRLLDLTQYFILDSGNHWIAPSFLCRLLGSSTKIFAGEEAQEVGWFPLNELPHPLTRTTRAALTAYYKQRKRQGDTQASAVEARS